VLAIGPHRDDVELTCGGTLIRPAAQGHRTGVLDLTQGEMGTRGSAELRAEEARRAARVLGLAVRENLALPDANIENTPETRAALVQVLRRLRPRDRHRAVARRAAPRPPRGLGAGARRLLPGRAS
jgi:LmbE family N-acetylglucosaminyl deacetylase